MSNKLDPSVNEICQGIDNLDIEDDKIRLQQTIDDLRSLVSGKTISGLLYYSVNNFTNFVEIDFSICRKVMSLYYLHNYILICKQGNYLVFYHMRFHFSVINSLLF